MWRESACWSGRKNSKDTGNAAEISEGRGAGGRSEDFSAARRRESIGIYQASKKSLDFFDAW